MCKEISKEYYQRDTKTDQVISHITQTLEGMELTEVCQTYDYNEKGLLVRKTTTAQTEWLPENDIEQWFFGFNPYEFKSNK